MSSPMTLDEEASCQLFQRLSAYLAKHGLDLGDLPDTDTTEFTSLIQELGITSAVERARYRKAIKSRHPVAGVSLNHGQTLHDTGVDVASIGSCSEAEPAAEAETEPSPFPTRSPLELAAKNVTLQGLSAALAAHTPPSFPDQHPCSENLDPKSVLDEVANARQTAEAAFSKLQVVLSALVNPDATGSMSSGVRTEPCGLQGP